MKRSYGLVCVPKENLSQKHFYGIKCRNDQVNLDDFILVLSNLKMKEIVHPSKVMDLFIRMPSYCHDNPFNYISKKYFIGDDQI